MENIPIPIRFDSRSHEDRIFRRNSWPPACAGVTNALAGVTNTKKLNPDRYKPISFEYFNLRNFEVGSLIVSTGPKIQGGKYEKL